MRMIPIFLITATVVLVGCNNSSSSRASQGGGEGGGVTGNGISEYFDAAADNEPMAVEAESLSNALTTQFGDADSEPRSVNAAAGVGGLLAP